MFLFLLSSLEYSNVEVQNLSLNRNIADNPSSIYPFSLEGTQKHITCGGCYFMGWESIGTYLMILYTKGSSICKLLWNWFVGLSFWKFSLSWVLFFPLLFFPSNLLYITLSMKNVAGINCLYILLQECYKRFINGIGYW